MGCYASQGSKEELGCTGRSIPRRGAFSFDRAHAAGAYIPFGLGPRVCVGAAFASLEATLILARLSDAFEFEVLAPAQVRPAARLTTRPEREIMVRLRAR